MSIAPPGAPPLSTSRPSPQHEPTRTMPTNLPAALIVTRSGTVVRGGALAPHRSDVLLVPSRPAAGGQSRPHVILKNGVDRVLASLLLVLLAVPMLLVALAVRLDSDGPAVFPQTRVGRGGRRFTMYKFRSMAVDAEARRERLRGLNEAAGPMFKMRRDPRVTRVGRFLRKASLDELPQLWNVVRGEMSLVGPRPALPEEVARYDERERRRLLVQPGMTGPWQVSGRSRLSWEEAITLDLAYVDGWSVWGDAVLLLRTVRAVFTGDGAR
ncbi:sugar transferase [Nocardioides sp. Iso805N]|uniref:sugar transferase n=1 Tax=Nocardioides sp. Iso805N TaxID=1283287 RepID=UPI0003AA4BE7|nr:sugar transferase [Nocardioides sp. Iso805N]